MNDKDIYEVCTVHKWVKIKAENGDMVCTKCNPIPSGSTGE